MSNPIRAFMISQVVKRSSAKEYVAGVLDRLPEWRSSFDELLDRTRWIPVSERIPDLRLESKVLVITRQGDIDVKWPADVLWASKYNRVIYWMPIKPPENLYE